MTKISKIPPHPTPPSTFFQNITLLWFTFYFSGQFSFATLLLHQHLVHQALVLGLPFFSFCTFKDVQFIYRVSIHYFPQQTTYILVSHLYLWARCLNSRPVYWLAYSTAFPGCLYSLPGWPSCPALPRRGFLPQGDLISWWYLPYSLTCALTEGNHPLASPIQLWLKTPETLFLTTPIQYFRILPSSPKYPSNPPTSASTTILGQMTIPTPLDYWNCLPTCSPSVQPV